MYAKIDCAMEINSENVLGYLNLSKLITTPILKIIFIKLNNSWWFSLSVGCILMLNIILNFNISFPSTELLFRKSYMFLLKC